MREPNTLAKPPPGMKDPLTADNVATLFNVNTKTIARWHSKGWLEAKRTPGGHRRYPWHQFPPLLAGSWSKPAGTLPAPDPDIAASATIRTGAQSRVDLFLTPVAGHAEAGHTTLILGYTRGGKPVTLTIRSVGWLDDLLEAGQLARAAGVVEADMAAVL